MNKPEGSTDVDKTENREALEKAEKKHYGIATKAAFVAAAACAVGVYYFAGPHLWHVTPQVLQVEPGEPYIAALAGKRVQIVFMAVLQILFFSMLGAGIMSFDVSHDREHYPELCGGRLNSDAYIIAALLLGMAIGGISVETFSFVVDSAYDLSPALKALSTRSIVIGGFGAAFLKTAIFLRPAVSRFATKSTAGKKAKPKATKSASAGESAGE